MPMKETIMNKDLHKLSLQIILAISLLANGYMIGSLSQKDNMPSRQHHMKKPPNPMHDMFEAADDLQPDIRDKILSVLKEHDPKHNGKFRQGFKAFDDMRQVTQDPDATLDDLNEVLERLDQHHKVMGNVMGDQLRAVFTAFDDSQQRMVFFRNVFNRKPHDRHGKPPHRP